MTDKGFIGYVAIGEDGTPYQPTLGTGWQSRKKPTTVYKTLGMARKQSPISKAYKVFMVEE